MRLRVLIVSGLAGWVLACSGVPGLELPALDVPDEPALVPGTSSDVDENAAVDAEDGEGSCEERCELLMGTPFQELQRNGAPAACRGEWPLTDAATCYDVDKLRNCIYARLGYDFPKSPQWRTAFDREPWYRVDPAFDWDNVTPIQAQNAKALKGIVRRKLCRS